MVAALVGVPPLSSVVLDLLLQLGVTQLGQEGVHLAALSCQEVYRLFGISHVE